MKVLLMILALATAVRATPPGPGQRFDCGSGGTSSCASDDTGCVPDVKNHLKCSDKIGKAFAKAIRSVIKCHRRQADDRFAGVAATSTGPAEDLCSEGPNGGKSAKEKLDAAIAALGDLCSATQLGTAAAEEATLFADQTNPASLDARNGSVYCAGAVDVDAGGDDAGKIPGTKDELACADRVGLELGKLAAAAIKCHQKMADGFFAGKDFDESACEEMDPLKGKAALQKYARAMDTLDGKGICTQSCLDRSSRDALAGAILGQIEASNASVYPCPTSTTTSTTTTSVTTTTSTTSTTTTTCPPAACACAGGTPSLLSFTTGPSGGVCGHLDSDSTPAFLDLACGGLYFGGGGVGVPLPSILPDMGNSLFGVCCNGTGLTLHATSAAAAGGNRCAGGSNHGSACTFDADCPGGRCKLLHCTSVGCLFGPPLPLPSSAHMAGAASTCSVSTITADVTGAADCSTGDTSGFSIPTASALFVTGDLLPNRCSGGSTPGAACSPAGSPCPGAGTCVNDTGRCKGGSNPGTPCVQDSDCTGGGTCETGACQGGPDDGAGCIVSADCGAPGVCRTFIQPCPICNPTTNTCNGGPEDGLACTPGTSPSDSDLPTSHDCPPPGSPIGSLPIPFLLESGTVSKTAADLPDQANVFCGFCRNKVTGTFKNPPVPCTGNADCAAVSGFTSCGQRTSGAFTTIDVARTIVESGTPSGALTTGGTALPSVAVGIFCMPPTFNALVDAASDLPGPGATAMTGVVQLLP